MELTEFLLARLDEDERIARAAMPGPWSAGESYPGAWSIDGREGNIANENRNGDISGGDAEHIARHDPARVMDAVAAARRIVEWGDAHPPSCNTEHPQFDVYHPAGHAPHLVLRLLALPYATHPDYRQDWKP